MNADLNYKRTQMGWVILALALLPAPVLLFLACVTGLSTILWILTPLTLALVTTFGSLTVRVSRAAVSLRFGIGLVRRSFPIHEIRAFSEVENPWYFGWGIHFYPGGTLYNVSGQSAVELELHGGRRVRIGTNEPAELYLALKRVLGNMPPSAVGVEKPALPRPGLRWFAVLCVLCVGLGLTTVLHYQARPPSVSLTAYTITVDNLFYGESYPLSEVSKVELLQSLPAIRLRTNGYSAGGTLRGWFTLEGLGNGKLFVEAGHPPYAAVYFRAGGFVLVNYSEPEETRRLFAAIQMATNQRN